MLPHSEYVTLRRWRQRRVSRKRLVPGSHSGRFRRSVDNTSLTASYFNKHVCKRAFFRFIYFLITPCNRVLPEMLTCPQLFKFSKFYWTRRFITAFTRIVYIPSLFLKITLHTSPWLWHRHAVTCSDRFYITVYFHSNVHLFVKCSETHGTDH